MAKLTWTMTTAAGAVSYDGPEISEASIQRVESFLWSAYPQVDVDEDGVETPKPRNPANEGQAFKDWAEGQWFGVEDSIMRTEGDEVSKTARNGVGPLS